MFQPRALAGWRPVTNPAAELPEWSVVALQTIVQDFPEIRGRLTDLLRDEVPENGERAEFVVEAHLHCTPIGIEDEFQLCSLGFQPDFFLASVPGDYTSCWTLRLVAMSRAKRSRAASLMNFVRAQLGKAHTVVAKHPSAAAYSEIEIYGSARNRRWAYDLSTRHASNALRSFPFARGAFQMVAVHPLMPPADIGVQVAHKNYDLHVKICRLIDCDGFSWRRESLNRAIVNRFLNAGFYRVLTDSSSVLVSVQLRDRADSREAFRRICLWADSHPGVIASVKLERCPFVWVKVVRERDVKSLSPLPPLVQWANKSTVD
jgi:hypothetical protein